jgi:TolB-like protein
VADGFESTRMRVAADGVVHRLSPPFRSVVPLAFERKQNRERVAGAVAWLASDRLSVPPDPVPAARIAVLPFSVHSNDPADVNLARRLTDTVTAALVRRGDLTVISSTSARQFEHVRDRLGIAAGQLGADTLVEGNVLTEGDHVYVDVRAVAGRREQKVWVETFTGTVDGTIGDVADLAQRIADALPAPAHDDRRP